MHAFSNKHKYTNIYIYKYTCTNIYKQTYINKHKYTNIYIHTHIYFYLVETKGIESKQNN